MRQSVELLVSQGVALQNLTDLCFIYNNCCVHQCTSLAHLLNERGVYDVLHCRAAWQSEEMYKMLCLDYARLDHSRVHRSMT